MKLYLKHIICLSWAVLGFGAPGYASLEIEEENAKTYFAQEQYNQALDVWYGLLNAGHTTPGIYYNIGVAESLLKHVPEAMLAYEQALRLRPLNTNIKAAILDERKKIENATIPIAPFFLTEWYKGFVTLFRPGLWAFIGLCLLGLGLMSLLRDQLRNSKGHFLHPMLKRWLIASGFFCLAIAGLSYKEIYREDEAILMERSDVRQAATNDSPIVRTLYPGEKIRITDVIGEWYNVELLNLDGGWIKQDHLQFVRIRKR